MLNVWRWSDKNGFLLPQMQQNQSAKTWTILKGYGGYRDETEQKVWLISSKNTQNSNQDIKGWGRAGKGNIYLHPSIS